MGPPAPARIGVDTGGTFTDVVLLGPRGRRTAKVASTPERPAEGFLAALRAVGDPPPTARLHHGTTVATNAVLTRRGARVALVTTAGYEDLPWLGRGQRDGLHALRPERTPPLLARGMTFGLEERLDARGRVLDRPPRTAWKHLRRAIAAKRPDAIAVCLLHAVQDDVHEAAACEALRSLGVPVQGSAAVSADPREFERLTTVLLDAYVSPVLRGYVRELVGSLPAALAAALTVMRSDGGRMTPAEVEQAPVRTLLSGPAGGVAAAQALAGRLGTPRALSFDVGGTSTDVAWIEGDDLPLRPSLRVGPYEAGVPSVGLETVGAGGGSEVWIDAGGALRVGPASAGAAPGPACYGEGGPFCLTDAWLLLGRLPPALLGGAFALERDAARRAGTPLARRAGCSLPRLCEGAVRVAAATTARALRLASAAHGKDPRHAALIAFGGAGPMLAVETAALLGVDSVYVPADSGTFAAEGTLLAPLRADASRVVTTRVDRQLGPLAGRLARDVRARLRSQGARHVRLRTEVDARYAGQAFEVTTAFGPRWRADFHGRHAAHYGFALPRREVQAVRLRVRGDGWEVAPRAGGRTPPALPRRWRTQPVRRKGPDHARVARARLTPGCGVRGPVRIEETSGTTYVPAGWLAGVLRDGTLRLERTR